MRAAVLLPLLVLLLAAGAAPAAGSDPAFRAEGRFLVGNSWLPPHPDPCGDARWDGVSGSCVRFEEDYGGRLWTLRVESATVAPAHVVVCFSGEGAWTECVAGDANPLESSHPVPVGATRAAVTGSEGLDVAWSLQIL